MRKLKKIETLNFPTTYGDFNLIGFETNYPSQPEMHYALVIYTNELPNIPLVRVHSECILSEVFHSTHCDCADQLDMALKNIQRDGGILIYLNQEGRGHGLIKKLTELKMQEDGLDTVEASEKLELEVDQREYDVVSDILKYMQISEIKLMTNNPRKVKSLEKNGIVIKERVPLETLPNPYNKKYLTTKKNRLGHMFTKYI